jgi:phosphomannomutase
MLDDARRWLAADPDPATRAELESILAAAGAGDDAALADLADRFAGPLEFGTAGLRGAMGAGPNRMNRVVVRRTAAGLAAWLQAAGVDATRRGVVVGFDARHHSLGYARDTAAVLAAAGVGVHLMPGPLPTPVLAFAVRQLGCAAGVMVTASHNPAADNGYKVYDATGSQIVSPADREIAAAIDGVGPVLDLPIAPLDHPLVRRLGPEVVERYVNAVVGLVDRSLPGDADRLVSVYTPMHGVGGAVALMAFSGAGLPIPYVVAEQADPDPDFPTLPFPNPEEPGALDRAIDLARTVDADLVLANDPDADRLGVAVPDRTADGGWRLLSGDEIGVLLAGRIVDRLPVPQRASSVVATTIVSSTLLSKLAAEAGVGYAETLTGFKWIARAADGDADHRLVFGYEEALGSCVAPSLVRDKDGISAALVFADLVRSLKAEGRTVTGVLDDLATRFGVHATSQWSLRLAGLDGVAQREAAMSALRSSPPTELAGRPVRRVVDLLVPDGPLPASDVVVLHLDGARVVVRPSGTEPKLKCYFEVVVPVDRSLSEARVAAADRLTTLREAVAAVIDPPAEAVATEAEPTG